MALGASVTRERASPASNAGAAASLTPAMRGPGTSMHGGSCGCPESEVCSDRGRQPHV